MGRKRCATVDDSADLLFGKRSAMATRNLRKIGYHGFEARRDAAVAVTLIAVATGAKSHVELGTGVMRIHCIFGFLRVAYDRCEQ